MPTIPGPRNGFASSRVAAAETDQSGTLPWTVRRDVSFDANPELFARESFVCVTSEAALDAPTPQAFLEAATELMNDRLWGTLAAAITVPQSWQRQDPSSVERAIGRLRYGTIGVNQWPGIAYALMTPPWGAYPGGTLRDAQSGIGFVHNTYLLNEPQKTVLRSPLAVSPKPVWFSTHRRPEAVAWKLCELYRQPSLWKIPGLLSQGATRLNRRVVPQSTLSHSKNRTESASTTRSLCERVRCHRMVV